MFLMNFYFLIRCEANFARILDYCDIKWKYEDKRFVFKDKTSYLPDFYLPKLDLWVEIKGYYLGGVQCLQKMQTEFPDEKVRLISKEMYFPMEEDFAKYIENWEYKK